MRLSDIKGERVLDVIADLIDPICNIATTEEIKRLFTKDKAPEGMSAQEFGLKKMRANVPALIKHCKHDIITVLAILDNKDRETYAAELNAVKLVSDVAQLLNDPVCMELFLSAQQEGETPSGAAPEITVEANR